MGLQQTAALRARSAVYSLTARWENPTGLARPLWRDVSRWQGVIDTGVMKENGVNGLIARAVLGLTPDPTFEANYQMAGQDGLYRTSYGVPIATLNWDDQLTRWFQAHEEIDIIPRCLDIERSEGSLTQRADMYEYMSERILAHDGQLPILYTNVWIANNWFNSLSYEWMNRHYWFIAKYYYSPNEHPGYEDWGTVLERIDDSRILLHQTSDNKPGFPGEVQSASVDWDRWEKGNAEEMHAFIQETWGTTPEPPTPPHQYRGSLHYGYPTVEGEQSQSKRGQRGYVPTVFHYW